MSSSQPLRRGAQILAAYLFRQGHKIIRAGGAAPITLEIGAHDLEKEFIAYMQTQRVHGQRAAIVDAGAAHDIEIGAGYLCGWWGQHSSNVDVRRQRFHAL